MIERRELLRRLHLLARAATRNVPYINSGGCAVFAGIVGTILKKQGFEVEVVTPASEGYNAASNVRKRLEKQVGNSLNAGNDDWADHGLIRWHFALRLRVDGHVYTWDSDGLLHMSTVFSREDHFKTSRWGTGLTVEECVKLGAEPWAWNTTFDRSKIPLLQHLANHYLKWGLK